MANARRRLPEPGWRELFPEPPDSTLSELGLLLMRGLLECCPARLIVEMLDMLSSGWSWRMLATSVKIIDILFAGDAIRDWIETSRSFAPRCKIWETHHATVWVATHWSIHLSCPEASGGSWCSGAPLLSRGISITWALLQPVIMPKVTEKESDA